MFKSEKGRQVDEILLCRGGMASHLVVLFLKKLKFILAIDDKYNIMNV